MPIDEIINDGTNMVVGAAQGAVADQQPLDIEQLSPQKAKDVNWYNKAIDVFNLEKGTKLPKVADAVEIADDDYMAVTKHFNDRVVNDYNTTNDKLKLGLPLVTDISEIKPENSQKIDEAKVVSHINKANKELKMAQDVLGGDLLKFEPFRSLDDMRNRADDFMAKLEKATNAKDKNKLLSDVNKYIENANKEGGFNVPLFSNPDDAKKAITVDKNGVVPLAKQFEVLSSDKQPDFGDGLRSGLLNPMATDLPEKNLLDRQKAMAEKEMADLERSKKRIADIAILSKKAQKDGTPFLESTYLKFLNNGATQYASQAEADAEVVRLRTENPNIKGVGVRQVSDEYGNTKWQVSVAEEVDAQYYKDAQNITAEGALIKHKQANALMPEYKALKEEINRYTMQGIAVPPQILAKYDDVSSTIQDYLTASNILTDVAAENYVKYNNLESKRGGSLSAIAFEGVESFNRITEGIMTLGLTIPELMMLPIPSNVAENTDFMKATQKGKQNVGEFFEKRTRYLQDVFGIAPQYRGGAVTEAVSGAVGILPYILGGELAVPFMVATGVDANLKALEGEKSLSTNEKNLIALVKGSIGAYVMSKGLDVIGGHTAINRIAYNTMKDLPVNFTGKTLQNLVGKEVTQYISNTAATSGSFGILNPASGVADIGITELAKVATDGRFNPQASHDVLKDLAESFVHGLGTGVVLGGVTGSLKLGADKISNEREFRQMDAIAQDPSLIPILKLKLGQQVVDKKISADEYKKAIANINSVANIASQIPKDFSNSSRYQSFKLLKENAEYEKQKAGLAPVYIKRIDGLIEANNAELIKIADNESVKSIPNDTQNTETTNSESATTDGTNEVAKTETKAVDDGNETKGSVVENELSPLQKELQKAHAPQKLIDAVPKDTELREGFLTDTKRLVESLIGLAGNYSIKENKIRIGKFYSSLFGGRDKILIHEAAHAATMTTYEDILRNEGDYTKEQVAAVRELNYIASQYIANTSIASKMTFPRLYGTTNPYEFIAEFIANPNFRKYVSENAPERNTNIVNYVWDAILRMLGVQKAEVNNDLIKRIQNGIDMTLEISASKNKSNEQSPTPTTEPIAEDKTLTPQKSITEKADKQETKVMDDGAKVENDVVSLAAKIRKLKTQKGALNSDITFGLRNYAIEEIAQLVEDGITVIDAVKKVLADVKYSSLNKDEIEKSISTTAVTNDALKDVEYVNDFIKSYGLNEKDFSDIKTNVRNEETRKLYNAVADLNGEAHYTGDFTDGYASKLREMGSIGYEVYNLLNSPKKAAQAINKYVKEVAERQAPPAKSELATNTVEDKSITTKGNELADKIRSLKSPKGTLQSDITRGLKDYALEEIVQLIEDGTVVIEAIKKVLANSKYASLNKDEIRNLVFSANPLTEKDFERNDSEKVVDRNKRLEADLKQRGYTQNEIDYILRGGVDRIEKVDTVREETKVVDNLNKILKSVQAKAKDMPLKEAVDKAIERVQGEWVKGKEIILENAIRKFKKEHEIAVTNPTDRAVKPKPIMITVDEKKALTDQIKLEVKAATEGAKSITDGFKEVAKIVNEILKQHKTTISTRQLNAIQKRMAYLKVGSNESVRKYVDYIEKVLANAEYADQLASVKSTNKKLKKALKNDKIPASVRATANDFIKLDPADVENLNKHEAYANELLEAMKSGGIKVQDGNIVDKTRKAAYLSKIDAYIAKEKTLNDKRKEESEAEEVTSVATTDNTDEIKRYVQSKFDRLKVLVSQMLQTGLNLDGTPHDFSLKEKSDIAKMLKMDLNVFSNIKDWYEVVETLDHLLTNGDLGLTRNILNRYKAAIDVMKGVDILIRKTEDPIKFLPVTKFFADLESFLTAPFKSDVKDSYAQKLYFINSSLRRADNLVKNFKDNDIYENTFYHLAKAYANMKTKVRQMDAMKIHAKLFASNNFDSYRTLESKFKITAYLLQLQHEANPDNNKAKPAIEYLHATSESANSLEHPIQGKALVLLNQVIEQYSQNGQISLESLRKSFTPGEKAAIAAIQKTYKDLYPYHDEVAVAIRNKPSVPYNEYVHIQAILKRKGGGSASEMKKQEYINSLSTKAGTSEDRSGTAHPINMDPFSTANTAIRDVMLDYWMTNPMKNVEKILTTFKDYAVNDLKKYVRGTKEYKDALRKRNVAEAWRDIYEDLRNDVLARSYYESNWIKDIIQLAAKRAVQFTLAKPDRLMAEYLSNLSYVMIALPKEFLLGTTKYSKYLQPALSQQIMENLRSSATERLHPHGGLATSAMDTMDFDISVADNQNAVGEFQRRAMQIYYNTVARPIKGGQNLNEMMVNKGDLAIAIPVWKGVIATEFKRLTGDEIDFDKVASNDVEYFDKYESELYKSTAFADRKVTDVAASKNIFENAPKLSKKSIQLHHALNHYMSGFRMNEYELMADAIVHAAKDGKVSREEAARQIAGITARAGFYKAVQAKAATAMMAAIMGGWAMLQNDEEKTEVDKLIGNMGDDTLENRRKVAAKLLELFATSNPKLFKLMGMGEVGDALKTTDEETVKFWKRAAEEPNTFIEDFVKGIGQQYLSLLTQRNFGNIVHGFLTAPLFEEYVNKKLRDDYDPYKDSYLYSKLPDPDKKNWLIRSIEANLGAYGLPLAMLMDITVAGIELRINIKKLDAVNEELKKHIDKVPLEKNKLEDWYDLKDRQKSLEKKIEDSYKSIAKEVSIAAGMGTGVIPALKNIDKAMDKIMQDAYKLPKDWKKIQEKIEAIKNGVSPEDIMNAENKQKAVSEIYDVIEPGEKMPDKYDDAIKKVLEK